MKRQLAAILYADAVGYSRLTGRDEDGTHAKLNDALDLLAGRIVAHDGTKIHEAGDAVLAEFSSVGEAFECAREFQQEMARVNAGYDPGDRLEFRIGVNLGEVIHDRGDVYGDGVNLAARVQELAAAGGLCITGSVREQLRGTADPGFKDRGYKKLKNIDQPVHIFELGPAQPGPASGSQVFFDNLGDQRPVATGGCLCGAIRFEVRGEDIGSSYCHCRMCQRFAGAPVSSGTGFLFDDLEVTGGAPKIYRSSVIAERAFCGDCGSSLWIKHFAWKWVFIKTAALDNPEDYAPTTHFGVESQLPWHDVLDELPRIRSDDSPELRRLWEDAGVPADLPPRNTAIRKQRNEG